MKSRVCLYAPPLSGINSYFAMVDLAKANGLEYLEMLNVFELSRPDVEFAKQLRAYADSQGIRFPCASVGIHLVGEDHAAALETARGYAEVAAILGSPYLHHTICLEFEDAADVAANADLYYRRGLAAVREIYDHAATFGVRTVYEDQGFLFNGRKNFARFLEEVGRDVGVVADFGNIQFVDEEAEDFIAAFGSRIAHVHVKDYRVTPGAVRPREDGEYRSRGGNYLLDCPIGTGSVHMDAGFAALAAIGYRGPIALECGPMGNEEESLAHNIAATEGYIAKYLG